MYEQGRGVEIDYAKALKWYRKAAKQDLAIAALGLGSMYEKGTGIPKNAAKATQWYRKAAAQGLETAQNALNKLKTQSSPN